MATDRSRVPVVDLNDRELQVRIHKRAQYMFNVASWFNEQVDQSDVNLRIDELWRVAEGYYLLSEAFKAIRLRPGRRTEPTKIAAMMAMSIMTFRPFRPADKNNIQHPMTEKANQILAVLVASEILIEPTLPLTLDQNRRLLRSLDLGEARALAPYIVDAQLNKIGGSYAIDIELDIPRIDTFTLMFELMRPRGLAAFARRGLRRLVGPGHRANLPND